MKAKEYLNVPFEQKDIARKYGARYDGEARKWYIPVYIEESGKTQLRQLFGVNKSLSAPSLASNNHNVDDKSNHNAEEHSNHHAEESPFDQADINIHHHTEETIAQYSEENPNQYMDDNDLLVDVIDDTSEQTNHHDIEENTTHISDDSCATTQHNDDISLHQHNDNPDNQKGDASIIQHSDESDATTEDLSKWESALSNNTLNIIYMMKKNGLPENKVMRGRIFRRLKRVDNGDYPITYDGLKIYYPELLTEYPVDQLKEKIRSIVVGGDYKKNIEQSDMAPDEKGLLLFILP